MYKFKKESIYVFFNNNVVSNYNISYVEQSKWLYKI